MESIKNYVFTFQLIWRIHFYRFFPSLFPDERRKREVMANFLYEVYKSFEYQIGGLKGREYIEELWGRLSGKLPTNEREWIEFYKRNLILSGLIAPRIKYFTLREALEDRNKDTEKLIEKLESGKGTQKDIAEYNARTITKLTEALREHIDAYEEIDE